MASPSPFLEIPPLLKEIQRGEITTTAFRSIQLLPDFASATPKIRIVPKNMKDYVKSSENSAVEVINGEKLIECGLSVPLAGQTARRVTCPFWTTEDIRYMATYLSQLSTSIPPANPLHYAHFRLRWPSERRNFKSSLALLNSIPSPKDEENIGNCMDVKPHLEKDSLLDLTYAIPTFDRSCVLKCTYSCKKSRTGNKLKWKKKREEIVQLLDEVYQVVSAKSFNTLLARTNSGVYEIGGETPVQWYEGTAKRMCVSPHMENELCVVSTEDHVTFLLGENASFSHVHDSPVNDVIWTDHPRCVFVVADSSLHVQDCRRPGGLTVYSARESERLIVGDCVQSSDNKLITVCSHDEHLVFDIRRPQVALLSTPHYLTPGPSMIISSQPICSKFGKYESQFLGHRYMCKVQQIPVQTTCNTKPLLSFVSLAGNLTLLNDSATAANWLKVHRNGIFELTHEIDTRTKSALRGIALTPFYGNITGLLSLNDCGDVFVNTLLNGDAMSVSFSEDTICEQWNTWCESLNHVSLGDYHVDHMKLTHAIKCNQPTFVDISEELDARLKPRDQRNDQQNAQMLHQWRNVDLDSIVEENVEVQEYEDSELLRDIVNMWN